MADKINVGGRLHSIATGNILTGADEILDDYKSKKQSEINIDIDNALADRYTKSETYNKDELNSLITTPNQNYVTIEAHSGDTEADVFNEVTGASDTVYRVAKWNGTQYDTTRYAEYAFDGTAFIILDIKQYGVDNEPTLGSENFVKSDGIYKEARKIVDTATTPSSDLEIIDEQGNVLVMFKYGHVKTKNFDSSTMAGLLISNNEMDEVLSGELPVYLTDANGVAVLGDDNKPIEIID